MQYFIVTKNKNLDMAAEAGRPTPLHLALVASILDGVREGRFEAGAQLKEGDLAESLGVSRTPVRAALGYLAERGVVRRTPGGGILLNPNSRGAKQLAREAAEAAEEQDALRVAIARDRLNGKLPERFSEADLMRRYGMARTRVVQALVTLAEVGMIRRNPGHGWSFQPALDNAEQVAASYRFRLLIEPGAMAEPGFAVSPQWIAEMRARHRATLERPWGATSAVAFFEMNVAFHEGLVAASGNRFMLLAVQRQNQLRRLLNYDWSYGRDSVVDSCREHLAILDALADGAVPRAAKLLRRHLRNRVQVPRDFTQPSIDRPRTEI
jgi:DNA-binding GntR family transcriptional regulator